MGDARCAQSQHVLAAIHRLGSGKQHHALAREARVARQRRGARAQARVVGHVRDVEPRRLVPRAVRGDGESHTSVMRRDGVTVKIRDEQIGVIDDQSSHGPRREHEQGVGGEDSAAEDDQGERLRSRVDRGAGRPACAPPRARRAPEHEDHEAREHQRSVLPEREETELIQRAGERRQCDVRRRQREACADQGERALRIDERGETPCGGRREERRGKGAQDDDPRRSAWTLGAVDRFPACPAGGRLPRDAGHGRDPRTSRARCRMVFPRTGARGGHGPRARRFSGRTVLVGAHRSDAVPCGMYGVSHVLSDRARAAFACAA